MKSNRWMIVAALITLSAVALSSSPAPAQTKPIEMTYSMHFVASHQMAVYGRKWADEVEKRTNGRVKITMFPGRVPHPFPSGL